MAQRQWRSDDTDTWTYGFGDGSDGDLVISSNTTEAPTDSSCSGTSGTTSLTATNASFTAGQAILIHQTRGTGAGGWELNKIDSYTAGTITLKHALTMTYTDSGASQAQVIVLKQYNSVTVNSGVTWTAKAWNGDVGGILIFSCKGQVTINGIISASITGHLGGSGINNAGTTGQAYCGEGSGGTSSQTRNAQGNSGGGGYGDDGPGAGGGNASNGGNGSYGNTGYYGNAVGNASLTSMFFGGSGGGGAEYQNDTIANGGKGAGIICIFASDLVITGSIALRGGDGYVRDGWDAQTPSGAGAGGSCLVKCKTATLGTNLLTAAAGSTAYSPTRGRYGGAGSVGRIHLDYSGSYTGSTTPTLNATLDSTIVDATPTTNYLKHYRRSRICGSITGV